MSSTHRRSLAAAGGADRADPSAQPAETEVIITVRCKSRPASFDLASVQSETVWHKYYAERGVDLKRGVDY